MVLARLESPESPLVRGFLGWRFACNRDGMVYALVWLIDTKLNVWDADGKMVRTGLTGICCGLLFLTAIVVCLYQL
jgi:hypothetical protein